MYHWMNKHKPTTSEKLISALYFFNRLELSLNICDGCGVECGCVASVFITPYNPSVPTQKMYFCEHCWSNLTQ